jgi:hypothetical protein
MHVYKLDDSLRHRKVTLVEFVELDDDGEVKQEDRYGYPQYIQTQPARCIVCAWSEHLIEKERADERNRKVHEEREARERERERVYVARQKELEVARQKEQQRIEKLKEFVADKLGISKQLVSHKYGDITIRRSDIEEVIENSSQNVIREGGQEPTSTSTVS